MWGIYGQSAEVSELFLPPATYPLRAGSRQPIGGLAFRSAVIGVPAQVFGTLFYPGEATLEAASAFDTVVSSSGAISPGGQMTGRVNTDGTIAAGTGFTVIKGTAGRYRVLFNTAFASAPVALAIAFSGAARFVELTNITAAEAEFLVWTTAPALQDGAFTFLVTPMA